MADTTSTIDDSSPSVPVARTSYFLDLPPELRIMVYEHYYHDMPAEVDLVGYEDVVPGCSLDQVCRLIRHETTGMYEHSLKDFWSKTTFILQLMPGQADSKTLMKAMHRVGSRRIDEISRLLVRTLDASTPLLLQLTPAHEPQGSAWRDFETCALDKGGKAIDLGQKQSVASFQREMDHARRARLWKLMGRIRVNMGALSEARPTETEVMQKLQRGERLSDADYANCAQAKRYLSRVRNREPTTRGERKQQDLEVVARFCLGEQI